MRRDFTLRKRAILGGVILLVFADVALAAYSWRLSSAPRAPREQLVAETTQHNLLKADIKRAQDIRENIPAIQKDCDQFEQSDLMRRDFTLRKRAILGGVILLVFADVALAAYSWRLSSAPRAPREQLVAETTQHNLLKADIKRAQDIRENIPAIQKDCDQFEQ